MKASVDEVVIVADGQEIARHRRSYEAGDLISKSPALPGPVGTEGRALDRAAPLQGWDLLTGFTTLRPHAAPAQSLPPPSSPSATPSPMNTEHAESNTRGAEACERRAVKKAFFGRSPMRTTMISRSFERCRVNSRRIPCPFPVTIGKFGGDRFARDCLHSHFNRLKSLCFPPNDAAPRVPMLDRISGLNFAAEILELAAGGARNILVKAEFQLERMAELGLDHLP